MVTRQCVVLVGGLGTRLGDLTREIPKPFLPVGGRPFIEVLLREAARRGFDDIILLAGHRAAHVTEYVGESGIASDLNIAVRVSVEPAPLGTAGALEHAMPLLADDFLLLNGDTWFDFNWLDLVVRAHDVDCLAAMGLRQIPHPDRYETVEVAGPHITALRRREAGLSSGMINGGVYWLRKTALSGVRGPSSLEADVLPALCRQGKLAGWIYDGYFIDIGLPQTYVQAQHAVPSRRERPAVFFDRDGVLNEDKGYVHHPDEFVWVEGAREAIKMLNDDGYYVFIVTNQAGIAHGYYDEAAFHALTHWVADDLRNIGASIDDWRFSPYHPEGKVERYRAHHHWRKPGSGMIEDIIAKWPIRTEESFLVGDKESDIVAARGAGLRGYLFAGGNLLDFVRSRLVARADR